MEEHGPFYGKAFRAAWKAAQAPKRWTLSDVPTCGGIYMLLFESGHIYIGSAINLRRRCLNWRSRGTRSRKITLMRIETRCCRFKFIVLASSPTITRAELYRLEKQAIERAAATGAKLLNTTWA